MNIVASDILKDWWQTRRMLNYLYSLHDLADVTKFKQVQAS